MTSRQKNVVIAALTATAWLVVVGCGWLGWWAAHRIW